MSLAALEQSLQHVPFLATLGVRVDAAEPGLIVLRLPFGPAIANHAGAMHTAAICAVGETAAAVVVATHPMLSQAPHRQKSTRIKYYRAPAKDVTAHATLPDERIAEALSGSDLEITVRVLDDLGQDVAEVVSKFTFRQRA